MTDKQHLQRSTFTSKSKSGSPSNPPLKNEGERESGVKEPRCQNCGETISEHGDGHEPMRCPGGRLCFYREPEAWPRDWSDWNLPVQSREKSGDDATAAQACQSDLKQIDKEERDGK